MADKVTKNIRKALSKTDADKLAEAIRDIKPPMSNGFDKAMMKTIAAMMNKKEMGGEVVDMTKAQPVGMMDGGKVKKMNMGGVIGGRGGKFKGMR
jgi:hypothetical protein